MDMEGFIFRRESACACIARLGVAGVTPLVSGSYVSLSHSSISASQTVAIHSPKLDPDAFEVPDLGQSFGLFWGVAVCPGESLSHPF